MSEVRIWGCSDSVAWPNWGSDRSKDHVANCDLAFMLAENKTFIMPMSKQDARFQGNADQQRRLFNNTQGQNTTRTQAANNSSMQEQQKKQQDLGPRELLAEHMDESGNPVPETPTHHYKDEDYDAFNAMNVETKDLE